MVSALFVAVLLQHGFQDSGSALGLGWGAQQLHG